MKDLKHLIYFEDLLQEANKELVKQAAADGKKALGYTCYFVPEVLLNLGGCFSVRLRAPGTSNTDIGTYYMTNKTCPFTRSILERSMEGGYGGVFGTFFVCGLGEEDFCSLTPAQMETYRKKFHHAEILLGIRGNDPVTLKVQPKQRPAPDAPNRAPKPPER